jgi:hypothetical protein
MNRVLSLTLDRLVDSAATLDEVRKDSLQPGDRVLVKTVNSSYCIRSLGVSQYEVSGGWFERNRIPAVELSISGCTWGGSVIKMDLIAACGLRIEFGNRLTTSPVQKIFVLPQCIQN